MGIIDLELQGPIARIHLNHPPFNIFDFAMIDRLSETLDKADGSSILILSSTAENFSLGVDVKIHTPELSSEMLQKFHAVVRRLYYFEGISIVALNGYALGGAMELALVCDLIFARKEAKLGFPEIRLACFPPVAAILLSRKIGRQAARFLYTGETVLASEAERIGLVDAVFEETAEELIDNIKGNSFSAMKLLKKTLRVTGGFDFDKKLADAEDVYLNDLLSTPDLSEGVRAFLEKRSPRFRDH